MAQAMIEEAVRLVLFFKVLENAQLYCISNDEDVELSTVVDGAIFMIGASYRNLSDLIHAGIIFKSLELAQAFYGYRGKHGILSSVARTMTLENVLLRNVLTSPRTMLLHTQDDNSVTEELTTTKDIGQIESTLEDGINSIRAESQDELFSIDEENDEDCLDIDSQCTLEQSPPIVSLKKKKVLFGGANIFFFARTVGDHPAVQS